MDPMLQVSTVPSDQHQLITISNLTFDEIQMAHPNPNIKKKYLSDLFSQKFKKNYWWKFMLTKKAFWPIRKSFRMQNVKILRFFFYFVKIYAREWWMNKASMNDFTFSGCGFD